MQHKERFHAMLYYMYFTTSSFLCNRLQVLRNVFWEKHKNARTISMGTHAFIEKLP